VTDPPKMTAPIPLLVAGAAILLLVLAVAGCTPPQGHLADSGWKDEDMKATRDIVQEITIPPLDAAAPTQTETATFALG